MLNTTYSDDDKTQNKHIRDKGKIIIITIKRAYCQQLH